MAAMMTLQPSRQQDASCHPLTFPPSPPRTAKPSRRGSIDGGSATSSILEPAASHSYDAVECHAPYPLPPQHAVKRVLSVDLRTPDSHVERDPRLIRLTGTHPFNAEAPLSDLYEQGFLTSENLHYVRNHGHVPLCEDRDMDDWTFTVGGMVASPLTISVRELIDTYEQATYPVTLVCAGNRRKEQNVLRKSKGFSWGPAGLSTALWTGAALADVLARAQPLRGAKYVCFEGADKLPNGAYGTSVKLNWCMDPNKGILVAHKMNGRALHPDHGKPVRIVIPGQIGGRSVKWLRSITVTAEPSDNWYHIYDNRVLPTTVTPEASADLPETWKDERYAIYDLNVNSAICYPAHGERLDLATAGPSSSYKVRGYAYGGGGRRITRVEVTLDRGKTWRLAGIEYPEDKYRLAPEGHALYGGTLDMSWRETSFCWCFWEVDMAMTELAAAADVMVRAMDEGLALQPRDMYWSVLGMMNNPWFRVVIHHRDGHCLEFEHPTQPALMPGGWMERVKKAGGDLANGFWGDKASGEPRDGDAVQQQEPEQEICMTNAKVDRLITLDELREHSGETEPWFVVKGHVYDGSAFLEGHPGGATSIVGAAAQDVTEEFVNIHSENAKAMMPKYHIGRLDETAAAMAAALSPPGDEGEPDRAVFLDPKAWSKAVLQDKVRLSADTKIFRFKLGHEKQIIGLPVGQHLMMRLRDPATREAVIRAYTPVSEGSEQGVLDVLVKIYYQTSAHGGGKMTQALDSLPLGHAVDFKGPVGKFEYLGEGLCTVSGRRRSVARCNMICAGSGVTPIFQVLRALTKNPRDATECVLVDGNRVEEDILCRSELDTMVASAKHRCRLLHTLTQPSPAWTGRKGRIDRALVEAAIGTCRKPGADMVLICGPERMEKMVHGILLGLGWTDEDVLFF